MRIEDSEIYEVSEIKCSQINKKAKQNIQDTAVAFNRVIKSIIKSIIVLSHEAK